LVSKNTAAILEEVITRT